MKNLKLLAVVAGVLATFLSASAPVFASGDRLDDWRNRREERRADRPRVAAPEIDVSAGTKGLAIVIVSLLLAAEGLRRRR